MTAAYLIVAHRDPVMFQRLVAALPNDAPAYAHMNAQGLKMGLLRKVAGR